MTKNFALIPARSGSKGVKNKNIINFGGHPLLAWTIKACKQCPSIDRIFLSTDSEDYAEIAIKYGAEVPFLRPKAISMDSSSDYEFIIHFINWLDSKKLACKNILHMRPTTPLRDPNKVEEALNLFDIKKNATALRSLHLMSESAYKTFEITSKGKLIGFASESSDLDKSNIARQQFPKTYFPNGYVDVLSYDFIKNNHMIHGNNVIPFLTDPAFEIDEIQDLEFLEFLLKKNSFLKKLIFN